MKITKHYRIRTLCNASGNDQRRRFPHFWKGWTRCFPVWWQELEAGVMCCVHHWEKQYIYINILNKHDVVIFNVKVPFNAATLIHQRWFFLCGGERLVWLLCSWLIYVFSHQVSVFTWRVDWLPFCSVWFRTVNMSSEPQPAVWGLSHVASYSFSVRYWHWRSSAEQRCFHCLPCISCFFFGGPTKLNK